MEIFAPRGRSEKIAQYRHGLGGYVTRDRPDLDRPLTTVNTPRRAPVVLSQKEVARLLEAAPGLKVQGRAQRRLRRWPAGV